MFWRKKKLWNEWSAKLSVLFLLWKALKFPQLKQKEKKRKRKYSCTIETRNPIFKCNTKLNWLFSCWKKKWSAKGHLLADRKELIDLWSCETNCHKTLKLHRGQKCQAVFLSISGDFIHDEVKFEQRCIK